MKVLLLNQAFYPDVVATAQHSSDLAQQLVERGHDVTVVCGRRAYDSLAERYAEREVWHGVDIRRIWSSSFGKKSRWRRAADFATYLASCVVHLGMLPRYDLVIAMTSPPLISWIGAIFTRLKGGRLAFWVMDLNPDEALAAGWLRPASLTTKSLDRMLRYSLRRAAVIVALDRYMAERIEKKGIEARKIVIVAPWSNDRDVRYDPVGRAQFRRSHGLDGKFVVMYSGNHSPCHPLATLLEAARGLSDRTDVVFCFVGGGSEFETVQRFAATHALSNVVTLPYQPLSTLSASLSAADLHVVIMGDPFVGIVHPCKVYNVRALGIPYLYIGPAESHISELAPAFAARHGDVDAVMTHLLGAMASRMARVAASDQSATHRHDYLVEKMAAAFERVVQGPTQVGRTSPSASVTHDTREESQ